MKTANIFTTFLTSFFIVLSLGLLAQKATLPKRPASLVNDYVGLLSSEEIKRLETKLVSFNDSTGVQITIVIVSDFQGYEKAEYATLLGTEWGVGQKGFDNGVVILLNPTGKEGQRDAFIAIGYGLEAVIPDALALRIVNNDMLPYFKNMQYYQGLDSATTTIIMLANGEFTADDYIGKTEKSPLLALIPLFAILIIFILMRVIKGAAYSGGKKIPFWTALMLLSFAGRGNSGSWGNFSGGGGGSFGGFGGGSFGGGGAGGRW